MATGDETKAGQRPSLPPRPAPVPQVGETGGRQAVHRETKAPGPGNGIGPSSSSGSGSTPTGSSVGDGGFWDDDPGQTTRMSSGSNPPPDDQLGRFGSPGPLPDTPPLNLRAPKPHILAPQATEWETNKQEIEVVKSNRVGLVLLVLLALLVVAVIALGLAARSVLGGGDDLATDGSTTDSALGADDVGGELDADGVADGDGVVPAEDQPATTVTTVFDPNQLQVQLTESPFVCDGEARPFANLSGAAADEEITFVSPQSSGILPGTAAADGTLTMRWQCDADQIGTVWDVTATGVLSGKAVTFSIAGVDASDPAVTTVPVQTDLTVSLIESPFLCDGETRIFGGLSGAEPNEQISFSSPQSSGLSPGTADADGNLQIRWDCDPTQAGTIWELTATGVTSGRAVTFSFTGS